MAAVALALPAPALASHAEPLRAQWHLDGAIAGSTPDSSGHGLDGAASTEATFVAGGRFGFALDLPTQNSSGSRVDVSDSPDLQPQQLTVLAWVKHSGSPGANKWVLAKGGETLCNGASYGLTTGAAGGLQFEVFDTAVHLSPDAGAGIWNGQWHAIAGTYDGAALRLYVDGVQVGSGTPHAGGVGYGLLYDILNLGNYPASAFCSEDFTFPGLIDEARVYGRALSPTEIARLAAAPGPEPPVLVPDGPPNPVAQLEYTPAPTCVGSMTTFSAAGSTPGASPIVSYRFEYQEHRELPNRNNRPPTYGPPHTVVIGEGAAPTALHWFGFNIPPEPTDEFDRAFSRAYGVPVGPFHPAYREQVRVFITVTDAAGLVGSTSREIEFAQIAANQPRTGCPARLQERNGILGLGRKKLGTVVNNTVLVPTSCPGPASCVGNVITTGIVPGRARPAARRRKRARPPLLAWTAYSIPAGSKATLRAKLNRKARRLLRRKGRVRAKVSLLSVTRSGKTVTRSRAVTLKRKGKRKRRPRR